MSIRKFNRDFESVSNDIITAEDEAHLHCILGVSYAGIFCLMYAEC